MPRKKKPINPLQGKRLYQLLEETKTTQKSLSEHIYLTQQTISEITRGNASLTQENAERINKLFPNYSAEWLLGLSDYKNDAEKNIALLNKAMDDGGILEGCFKLLAKLKGFIIVSPDDRLAEITTPEETIRQHKLGYYITDMNGKGCSLSPEDMSCLENDVCDYVEYCLNRWIKKGR